MDNLQDLRDIALNWVNDPMEDGFRPYEYALAEVAAFGAEEDDRTGTGTLSVFGNVSIRYDLIDGFPLITSKKVHWKSIAEELLWFLRGDMNVKPLQAAGVTIWDEWAREDGSLGPVYGHQWRKWPGKTKVELRGGSASIQQDRIDQIAWLINEIKTNPSSRRLLLSAWNPTDLPDMALPPCHVMAQFKVVEGHLSCQVYQRSGDMFLGVPFNIASYALLTHLLAAKCSLGVGALTLVLGDAHIYKNHLEQVAEQLSREPRPLPRLEVLSVPEGDIGDFTMSDFRLTSYNPHPAIKGAVSV